MDKVLKFRAILGAATAVGVLALPLAASATPPPKAVSDMIAAAAASGDPVALKAVVDAAKKTNPDSAAEIDAQVKALADQAEAARVAKIEGESFLQGWTGKGELGGYYNTGNTDDEGFAAGLSFAKETLRWKHKIAFAADYQRANDVTSKERYFAGYEVNYKFSDRMYVSGILSGEHDKFAGFKSRFIEGIGLGYKLVDSPDLKINIEAGPALRQTDYYVIGYDSAFAGRIAGDLTWNWTPDTAFTETASAVFDSNDTTLTSVTAITTKFQGALSGRASFDVRYESAPPPGRENTDTTTRLTLVYSF
jgi:putative salt-induced outer membrane protein